MDWLRWLLHHPVLGLAVKAATAAGIAFFLGSLLPPPLEQYKYYAALGAFTVVGLILVDSVTESLRVFGAVFIGVAVAVVIQLASWTNPLSVAIAVLVCVLLGALPVLGEQRTWAPLAALFVLATGGPEPEPMALGYLVQVPLGAVVGVVVNLVLFAPLGAGDLDQSSRRVRELMVRHMNSYADILEEQLEGAIDDEAAAQRTATVTANLQEMHRAQFGLLTAIADGHRSRRGNPRARSWVDQETVAEEKAEAISRCAAALSAVAVLVKQADRAEGDDGKTVRRDAIEVLRRAAEVFDDPERLRQDEQLVQGTRESLDRMIHQVRSVDRDEGFDHVLFGALALAIRQCLEAFAQEVANGQ